MADSKSEQNHLHSLHAYGEVNKTLKHGDVGWRERVLAGGGAAVLSAIIFNPLDVIKTRLQAQAGGPALPHHNMQFVKSEMYKGPFDAFCKISQQEGFFRLWRGTNASLLLAVPTVGIYMPCYDVFRDWLEESSQTNAPKFTPYAPLVAGAMARALACITCSPIELAKTRMQLRRHLLGLVESEANALSILGANFLAGIVAGGVAAAATCPLDVAKTRRQTEKDPIKAINTSTRKTVVEIWRDGGIRGLFAGVVPRVCRAGPSVGIVVSFYELVKYMIHKGVS